MNSTRNEEIPSFTFCAGPTFHVSAETRVCRKLVLIDVTKGAVKHSKTSHCHVLKCEWSYEVLISKGKQKYAFSYELFLFLFSINALLLHRVWFLKKIKDLKMGSTMEPVQSSTSRSGFDFIARYVKKHQGMWRKDKRTQAHIHTLIHIRKKSFIQCVQKRKEKQVSFVIQHFLKVPFIFKCDMFNS